MEYPRYSKASMRQKKRKMKYKKSKSRTKIAKNSEKKSEEEQPGDIQEILQELKKYKIREKKLRKSNQALIKALNCRQKYQNFKLVSKIDVIKRENQRLKQALRQETAEMTEMSVVSRSRSRRHKSKNEVSKVKKIEKNSKEPCGSYMYDYKIRELEDEFSKLRSSNDQLLSDFRKQIDDLRFGKILIKPKPKTLESPTGELSRKRQMRDRHKKFGSLISEKQFWNEINSLKKRNISNSVSSKKGNVALVNCRSIDFDLNTVATLKNTRENIFVTANSYRESFSRTKNNSVKGVSFFEAMRQDGATPQINQKKFSKKHLSVKSPRLTKTRKTATGLKTKASFAKNKGYKPFLDSFNKFRNTSNYKRMSEVDNTNANTAKSRRGKKKSSRKINFDVSNFRSIEAKKGERAKKSRKASRKWIYSSYEAYAKERLKNFNSKKKNSEDREVKVVSAFEPLSRQMMSRGMLEDVEGVEIPVSDFQIGNFSIKSHLEVEETEPPVVAEGFKKRKDSGVSAEYEECKNINKILKGRLEDIERKLKRRKFF